MCTAIIIPLGRIYESVTGNLFAWGLVTKINLQLIKSVNERLLFCTALMGFGTFR